MFLDNPIFGVGLNNYADHYQEYSRELGIDPRREARDPASLYLQFLADQGLVGTAAFILLFVFVFVKLFRSYKWLVAAKLYTEAYIASALFAGLAGYMFMALYKNNAYNNVLWVLVAICLSITQIAENYFQGNKDYKGSKEIAV
jgi:O-antigen ligase